MTTYTPKQRPEHPFISIVIPCYNEEESLPHLYERLTEVLDQVGEKYEIILANDGSRDNTGLVINDLVDKDARIRGVHLSRNFGHQLCLTAGLDHARGDVIVMMDADLQDPPELVNEMLAKWREGADVVYAQREKREGETFFKKITAAAFYRFMRFLTKIDLPVDTGDFRLIDRVALDAVLSLRESNRFLRGMFVWVGFRQEPVKYVRQARIAGETHYPLRKMVRFAFDAITSFSWVPLQFAVWLGLAAATFSFFYGINVVSTAMQGNTVPGWASTVVTVLFLGSVQLITIGLLGEYLGRVFDEVKGRPLYVVREVAERESENDSPEDKSQA